MSMWPGLVGDFSNSLLLDVDVDAGKSFLERVRSMQSTLHETAEHSAFRGLDVLREPGAQCRCPGHRPGGVHQWSGSGASCSPRR